jgi:hypothetical protein
LNQHQQELKGDNEMSLESAASQLSVGTATDHVARVHQAMQGIGRSVPDAETANRVRKRLVESCQAVAGRGHRAVGDTGGCPSVLPQQGRRHRCQGTLQDRFHGRKFEVGGVESGGPDVFIRVYGSDELLGESLVKCNSEKRITIDLRVGDILLLAVDADFQREVARLDNYAEWMQTERDSRLRRSLLVAMRGTKTLAGRSTGAVCTSDWDALLQQMNAILTTEGQVALSIGKRFQQHASDASSAGLDVQKTKSICDALADFRTALTAARQERLKTRKGALHAGVAT